MKKAIVFALVILLLGGCSQKPAQPVITVDDGSFSCTAQELIDIVNEGINGNNDILTVPDFVSSQEEISIGGTGLTLKLVENSSEKLEKIVLYWYSGEGAKPDNIRSSGYYSGVIFEAIAPNEADDLKSMVQEAMDMGSEVEKTKSGATFNYWAFGDGGNRLTIYPAKD